MLRVVCAWCGKELGTEEADTDGETHGICDKCQGEQEEEIKFLLDKMKRKEER